MAVNAAGGSGDPNRGTWCTPKWLAEIIGHVDLDPCSNSRSHIDAADYCRLEDGEDGLATLPEPSYLVFCNPPFGQGEVIKWVRHYRNTDFIFLLRWAPDTKWFKELWPKCWGAWFPFRRVNFEPPPGVESSTSTYPHALYLASEPKGDLLDRLLANGYLLLNHERASAANRGTGGQATGGAGGGGAGLRCVRGERCCEGKGPCPEDGKARFFALWDREVNGGGPGQGTTGAAADGVQRGTGGGAEGGASNQVRGPLGTSEGPREEADPVPRREVQPRKVDQFVCAECGVMLPMCICAD